MSKQKSPEEYIITGVECVWPDPDSMNRFGDKAQKIIVPFLNYIHNEGYYYARDTKLENESLLLEKAARDMTRQHGHLVVFSWVPGYPRTIIPLHPSMIQNESADRAIVITQFWEMYKDHEEAITSFNDVAKRAKNWATMRLDCTTQWFWDSEERNIYMPVCLGQPVA
jgi:hypothetical protein